MQEIHRYDGNPTIPLQCPPHVEWEKGPHLLLKLLAVSTNPDSQT
jgi:hypothetical protein